MLNRRVYRIVAIGIIILSTGTLLAGGGLSSGATVDTKIQQLSGTDDNRQIIPPRKNITVVTTDSNSWSHRGKKTPRSTAELIAFAPNGRLLYYNDSHPRYWDVDPVPGMKATVEYGAADLLNASQCPGSDSCVRNVFERVNLTTGNVTRIYTKIGPDGYANRWHDIDRINDTHLLVGDIARDRVFIVNVTTERITWQWNASLEYSFKSGGPYPKDWTHLNDVEYLNDGRVMVSLRNQDQVVFLDPQRRPRQALLENWTLGVDNNHDILYEQHNPDYIPRENGGPALLVADSENNRIVEYQRVNGTWNRTWTWTDPHLQWPRDADRLPNGHTLITDSNGNRVIEINKQGTIVWNISIAFPYEIERLGTGDESTNGPSNRRLNATLGQTYGPFTQMWLELREWLNGPKFSTLMYVLPIWLELQELVVLVILCVTVFTWGFMEWWWSSWSVSLPYLR